MGKVIFNIIVVLFVTQIVAGPTLILTAEHFDKIETLHENDSENNLKGESSDTNVLIDSDLINGPATEWSAEVRNVQFNSCLASTEDISIGVNHVPPEHLSVYPGRSAQ